MKPKKKDKKKLRKKKKRKIEGYYFDGTKTHILYEDNRPLKGWVR